MMNDERILFTFASSVEFSRLFPSVSFTYAKTVKLPVKNAFAAVLGVGLLEFAANLSQILHKEHYTTVILTGICGAYKNSGLKIGDVVRVDFETVGDMGVEEAGGTFLPWAHLGGGTPKVYEASPLDIAPEFLKDLKGVSGLSVNCCTGTATLADIRSTLFEADVESMEGAALLAVCNAFQVPCYEVRAVSNFVTTRKKSSWKIAEALLALKNAVFDRL